MSEENYDVLIPGIPPELQNIINCAVSNDLIPEKSKRQYEKCYSNFREWCNNKNVTTVSENIVLAYLLEKSKILKSSSLWSTYSMLKLMLNIRDGIDVTKFLKLIPFLKKKSVGYQAKKSKVLTPEQINLFLEKASDENYLLWKVILIMGISGAMRRDELTKMSIDDIRDENSVLIVTVPDANTGVKRTFTVTNPEFLRLYHKYAALRPKHAANRRVFYRYKNGKCNAQVVGVHKIGEIPSLIAKYLGLPNSKDYTGHCFRRSSATLLANSGYISKQKCQASGEGSSSAANAEINKNTRVGNLPTAEVNFEDNTDDQTDNAVEVKAEADDADVRLETSEVTSEDNSNELGYDPLDYVDEIKTEADEIDIKEEELVSSSPISSVHATKRRRLDAEHAPMDFTDAVKAMRSPLQEDEDLAFFYSLLPSVRRLNTDQKFTFRLKTMQLLQDIRNSFRIDASSDTDFNM